MAKKKSTRKQTKTDVQVLNSRRAGTRDLLKKLKYTPSRYTESKVEGEAEKLENDDNGIIDPHDRLDIPRSFVVRKGKINKNLKELIRDIRKLMSPYTALKLKDSNKASMKDYVAVAGHVIFI